jgi:hypothetical protein
MTTKPRPEQFRTRTEYAWARKLWLGRHGGSLFGTLAIAVVFGALTGSTVLLVLLVLFALAATASRSLVSVPRRWSLRGVSVGGCRPRGAWFLRPPASLYSDGYARTRLPPAYAAGPRPPADAVRVATVAAEVQR